MAYGWAGLEGAVSVVGCGHVRDESAGESAVVLECECGESDGQWDGVADVGNVPYLAVDYEAVRPSQSSRACWLYAIVVRNLVVACRDSRHMICRFR